MVVTKSDETLREAVAVFDDEKRMFKAVFELECAGFDRADVSVLSSLDKVKEQTGQDLFRVEDAEDDPAVPRTVPVGPASQFLICAGLMGVPTYVGMTGATVAALANGLTYGGTIVAGIVGGGIGLACGALAALYVARRYRAQIKDQLDHGGLVLWVHTRDKEHEARAREILSKHGEHVHDLHLHGSVA